MRSWLLALSFATLLLGQPPDPGHDPQRIALGLASPDPMAQAWAAYRAGQDPERRHTTGLRQLLVTATAAKESGGSASASRVLSATLSALVETDANVTAKELLPLYPQFDGAVLYLLARNPKEHAADLLPLFDDSETGARWLAVGNLLLAGRAPGFAAALLRPYKVLVEVEVTSPGMGVGGGVGGSSYGCGYGASAPSVWPPVVHYHIVLLPVRGSLLLATGPRTVYVNRNPDCTADSTVAGAKDEFRHAYLTRLTTGFDNVLSLRPKQRLDIVWAGKDDYDARLSSFRNKLQEQFTQLVSHLREQGLLTDDEHAAIRPNIVWQIHDHRPSPREELAYPQ